MEFRNVVIAFNVLCDPGTRASYDASLQVCERNDAASQGSRKRPGNERYTGKADVQRCMDHSLDAFLTTVSQILKSLSPDARRVAIREISEDQRRCP